MYGGHPTGRGSLPRAARARGSLCHSPNRCAAAFDPSAGSSREQTKLRRLDSAATGASSWRPTAHSAVRVVQDRCRNAHRSPPKLTSMRGVSLASTPSSPSFSRWYKCGSRTRDTRFTRPLLYPSELTCGGMKQSARAVRARTTRSGAQARQVGRRTHCRSTIDVSTSS